jgi:hypothetical protein
LVWLQSLRQTHEDAIAASTARLCKAQDAQSIALRYGSGIVGSALVGAFADGTPWPMGWVIALSGIGSLLRARLIHPAATRPAVC